MFTGYGTRSHRLGIYLLVVFALMWQMFSSTASVKREIHPTAAVERPAQPAADPSPDAQYQRVVAAVRDAETDVHPTGAEKEWGVSELAFAAMRTVVPLMGDLPHAEWQPSSREARLLGLGVGLKYETVAGIVHALSYLAIPLFLASITGFIKRRGE